MPVLPVNNPFEFGVGTRRSATDRSSAAGRDVPLDVEVGEEGGVDVSAGGSAAAEVHGVWAVETHAPVLGLDVA